MNKLNNIDGSMLRKPKLPDVLDIYTSNFWEVYKTLKDHYRSFCLGDPGALQQDSRKEKSCLIAKPTTNLPIIKMVELLNRVDPQVREKFLAEGQVFSSNSYEESYAQIIRGQIYQIFLILDISLE